MKNTFIYLLIFSFITFSFINSIYTMAPHEVFSPQINRGQKKIVIHNQSNVPVIPSYYTYDPETEEPSNHYPHFLLALESFKETGKLDQFVPTVLNTGHKLEYYTEPYLNEKINSIFVSDEKNRKSNYIYFTDLDQIKNGDEFVLTSVKDELHLKRKGPN